MSSPILFALLRARASRRAARDATLMVQREVADRIEGKPGTKDYGTLAIFVGLRADVRRLLSLPPGAFRPMPKVHSAVLRLEFHDPTVRMADEAIFERLVRSIFTQRRKTLANALKPFAEEHGVDARRRWRAPGSTASGDPRRCNSQNWRGLRTLLLLIRDELCYSLHEFSLSLTTVPADGQVGYETRGAQPRRPAVAPSRVRCSPVVVPL